MRTHLKTNKAVPWLKPLDTGFLQRFTFIPDCIEASFVVDVVALEEAFSEYFGLPLPITILPLPHTHISAT
jgi:hypothetical protein